MTCTASKIDINGHFNGNSPLCNQQEEGLHSLHYKNQPLSLFFILFPYTFKTYFQSSLQNISKLQGETIMAWNYQQLHTRTAIILIYHFPPRCRNKCYKIRSIGSDTHWILKLRNTTSFFPRVPAPYSSGNGARITHNTPMLSEVILVLQKLFE